MTIEEITKTVQAKIPGSEVYARDLTGEGNHFEAVVVASSFEGLSRLARHRLVLGAFEQAWDGPLHAFTFKTMTPQEWEAQ